MKKFLVTSALALALSLMCSCDLSQITCSKCGGTGQCQKCGGDGIVYLLVKCGECGGSGKCQSCNGRGYTVNLEKPDAKDNNQQTAFCGILLQPRDE